MSTSKFRRRLSDHEIQWLVTTYESGESSNLIATQLGVTGATICYRLRQHGVTMRSSNQAGRRFQIDHTFFDSIDTEAKAYVLGFLFADGCVSSRGNTVSIVLNCRDRPLLESIRRVMGADYPINEIYPTGYAGRDANKQARFTFSSIVMHHRLTELGCTPRKSLTLRFPTEVPRHLLRHFLRGYFDGDGCFHGGRDARGAHANIMSTRAFCEAAKSVVTSAIGIKVGFSDSPNKNGITTYMNISGHHQVSRFMDWLYADATIWLPRKREKYEAYLIEHAERLAAWRGRNREPRSTKTCTICPDHHFARGYCKKHWRRMYKRQKAGYPVEPNTLDTLLNRRNYCSLCGDPARGRGYCSRHYCRLRKREQLGLPTDAESLNTHLQAPKTCVLCRQPCYGHGYCSKHYQRWKRLKNRGLPHDVDDVSRDPIPHS